MGKSELANDPRFARNRDRIENGAELRQEISSWTKGLTKQEATELLEAAGVPGGPVLDTSELLNDPHLTDRGFITNIEHPDHGEVPILGWAARLSNSSVNVVAAPALGEHTTDVLNQDLDLSAAEIGRLRDESIIGGS